MPIIHCLKKKCCSINFVQFSRCLKLESQASSNYSIKSRSQNSSYFLFTNISFYKYYKTHHFQPSTTSRKSSKYRYLRNVSLGTSLVVQQLRLHTSTAGHVGLIPDPGKKIPHDAVKKKKKNVSLAHEFQELILQNHEAISQRKFRRRTAILEFFATTRES